MDGKGNHYYCQIKEMGKKEVICHVLRTDHRKQTERLHLAISPTKNRDRLEFMVEKLVEIGVSSILIMHTAHTERVKVNVERLEKKVLSAAKQSLRFYLPEVRILNFDDVLRVEAEEKWIAHCYQDNNKTKLLRSEGSILALIGPEGDFSPEEVAQAKAEGFKALDLGAFRLRTETAAMVLASQIAW